MRMVGFAFVVLTLVVFQSATLNAQWAQINGPYGSHGNEVQCLAISGTILFAGSPLDGVFRSTNNGASWTALNSGLTSSFVYSLAISGTNILAGTFGGGVFLSANNGSSWTAATSGLTSDVVYALAISGASIFAGTYDG